MTRLIPQVTGHSPTLGLRSLASVGVPRSPRVQNGRQRPRTSWTLHLCALLVFHLYRLTLLEHLIWIP